MPYPGENIFPGEDIYPLDEKDVVMALLAPPTQVTGATRIPVPYGLFSTVSFSSAGDSHWRAGGAEWVAQPCGPLGGRSIDCDSDGDEIPDGDADSCAIGTATPFEVSATSSGSTVGLAGLRDTLAEQRLLAREEAAVELAFWTGNLGNAPIVAVSGADVPAGSTAVSAAAGIGSLEQYIADNYGSLGVIHVSRKLAVGLLTGGVLTASSTKLTTKLGTPVVAGSGYPGTGPDGSAAPAGQGWAYATPALFGYRSEVDVIGAFDHGTNDQVSVASRAYLLGFDPCGVAAALINPEL